MLMRLQKILAQAGVCSRRQGEQYILDGKVAVDGEIIRQLGFKADPEKNRIVFKGKLLQIQQKVYFLLNKPKGYICTAEDSHARLKAADLIKGVKERLFTVGRLDKDTEGLIILTNDGEFAQRLMHPSFKVEKTYQVVLDKEFMDKDKKRLAGGVILDGKRTSPAKMKLLTRSGRRLLITIHEGRKRQIRRMFACLGYEVKHLLRVRYGPLVLGNLKPGRYRVVVPRELSEFFSLQ